MAKISNPHVQQLVAILAPVIEKIKRNNFEAGIQSYADIEAHYVNNCGGSDPCYRCRWDMFWNADAEKRSLWIEAVGYNDRERGINDRHINTALERALKNL